MGKARGVFAMGNLRNMKKKSTAAAEGDNRSCEYTVLQKIEGKWRLWRTLLILGYILFSLAYFFLCVLIKFYPLACFTPLFTWMVIFFTWRYVSVAYRYEIVSGDWIFTRVMSDRFEKEMFALKIKNVDRIAPYHGDRMEQSRVEAYRAERVLWAASSMDSPDLYYATYTDKNGKRTILYFEATQRALQLLNFYNKNTILKKVRY